MLINLTNRPSDTWSSNQRSAAEHYGEIVDFPMPPLPAEAPEEEADRITQLVVRRVLKRLKEVPEGERAEHAVPEGEQAEHAVVCQGDFVLVFRIVTVLKAEGIRVLAPAFARVTKPTLRPDGTTVPGYSFEFVRFRSY